MLSAGHATFLRRLALPVAVLALAAKANAQEQERKLIDRIMHPNMELHAEGFEKTFETKGSVGDRHAAVRSFGFAGRTANPKGSDGAFHAPTFNDGRGSFHSEKFTVKRATAADQHAALADRSFATDAVPVREDRLANKTLSTSDHAYISATKPYLIPGKRQDEMDELRAQKNLTIDQIRELLNKSR